MTYVHKNVQKIALYVCVGRGGGCNYDGVSVVSYRVWGGHILCLCISVQVGVVRIYYIVEKERGTKGVGNAA